MQLSHSFNVPARVEDVWAAFNRLDRVAPCFPGATLDRLSGDDFSGSIKIKFGPILLLYNGSGRIAERNQAERRLIIEAKGRDRRGQGGASVVLTADFLAAAAGTELRTETDLTLTGRPAQFGQALITEVVDRVLERFVLGVADQLTARAPVPPIAEPVAVVGPPDAAADGVLWVELEDAEPVIDPRGDDADFASPVPVSAAVPDAQPTAEPVPETAVDQESAVEPDPDGVVEPDAEDDHDSPAEPEPESDNSPTDFLGPGVSRKVPALRPVTPLPVRSRTTSGLRRYAPAAAAAIAGVTAVVVWAIGRRRR